MSLVKNKKVQLVKVTLNNVSEFNYYFSIPFKVDEIVVNSVVIEEDNGTDHEKNIIVSTNLPLAYNNELIGFFLPHNNVSVDIFRQKFQVLPNNDINGTYNFKFTLTNGSLAVIKADIIINLEFIELVK